MNNLASAENEILERIKQARNPVEDSSEQPGQDVEALPEEAEVEEVEAEAEAEPIEAESEESLELDEPEQTEPEQTEELYLELDGEEVNLNDVREWKQGHLRQADYTKKTQELAEQRKQFEAQQQAIIERQETLDNLVAELEVSVGEQESIDWEELRDYDPSEYIKQKEIHEKRKEALAKAKATQSQFSDEASQAKAQEAVQQLIQTNGWVKDGKETEQYHKDMKVVKEYLEFRGIPESYQQGILANGYGQFVIDAAKAHAASRAPEVKKVKKTTVVTKPSGARKPVGAAAYEKALAAHKRYGTPETALALRKAQRKLKGN